jgi:hypothetical protein
VNFYGHAKHAQAYLDEHPELTGRVLDQSAAVDWPAGCSEDRSAPPV